MASDRYKDRMVPIRFSAHDLEMLGEVVAYYEKNRDDCLMFGRLTRSSIIRRLIEEKLKQINRGTPRQL